VDRLAFIENRIRETLVSHEHYRFTPIMDSIAKAFLDLTLEFHELEDFNYLAVLMPKVVLGWNASLYLNESGTWAVLAASTRPDLEVRRNGGQRLAVQISAEPRQEGDDYLIPLHNGGAVALDDSGLDQNRIIGMLGLGSETLLNEGELFFARKYADLLALSLVQRLLSRRNQQHIAFIKKLVADIGHNVIVPNIFFKVYLRRLAGKMGRLKEIQQQCLNLVQAPPQELPAGLRDLSAELANANEGLQEEFDHIQKHYINTSLFLETLLRQSHFEKGRYVLQKKTCNFRRDIIESQVERFLPRLRERGIDIDLSAGGVPDQGIEAVVDVGLISQVYANLLSNAVKYTRPVSWYGSERKYIAYGLEVVPEAFDPGEAGIKLNLFSTGPPIAPADYGRIFEEGYRGRNVEKERGTGHGLFFVKEVVELHGGRVGYETTEKGNNFYFILPK